MVQLALWDSGIADVEDGYVGTVVEDKCQLVLVDTVLKDLKHR